MMEGDELPAGWCPAKLDAVCFKITDGSHNPPKKQETGLPMLSAINIAGRRINFDQFRHITPADFGRENKRTEVMPGDVLVTIVGTIGRTAVVPSNCQKFTLQRSVAVLKPVEVESKFLAYQLESAGPQSFMAENAKGTAQKGIYLRTLKELPLRIAPFPEQQRIVEKIETLFAELDKGEEALREVQKLLARYRQSVLKAAVTGTLIAKGATEWAPVVLGDLLADIRYGTAKKCRPDVAGTPVLRIPNVVSGDIDMADLKFTELTEKELEKLSLREGDMLIVRSNGSANLVGRGAIVTAEAVGMAYAGYLIRLRLDRKRILPAFLHIVLNSPAVRARIERQAKSTSGVHNLNSAETKSIAFDLPDIDTQAEIVEAVEEAVVRIEQGEAWCETELKRSAALRQSILKDAFSGKLVPQDPSDESAEKLLERIRAARAEKPKAKREKAAA